METTRLYPIGYVSRKTGLTTHTIRAWEQRYVAVRPSRSEGNQRLYSRNDIHRLSLLRRMVENGHAISRIAGLDDALLAQIAAAEIKSESVPRIREPSNVMNANVQEHLNRCLSAVRALDEAALEAAIESASVALPRSVLFTEVIARLMREIGESWARGTMKIVNEHMASNVVQFFLWDALRSITPNHTSPKMVVATPIGQWCQLGALMVAVTAADMGMAVHYLGPNLPAEEIAAAAQKIGAEWVALSILVETDETRLARELKKLRRNLPHQVGVLVGGNASGKHARIVETSGARWFEDLRDLTGVMHTDENPSHAES